MLVNIFIQHIVLFTLKCNCFKEQEKNNFKHKFNLKKYVFEVQNWEKTLKHVFYKPGLP
uniref:Uncharacterized protein n=1 Tax=uncultured Desulfobacterium sp. TaxID=201089 RepID=E1YB91_9BACT|nr:unknown protein [uncultured Desulfobacterium sp.]